MSSNAIPNRVLRPATFSTSLGVLVSAVFGITLGTLLAALLAIQFFGYKVATVQSSSMEPFLRRGDIVVSRPVRVDDIKAGQVVLFESGQSTRILVVHRVAGFVEVTVNIHDSKTGQDRVEHQRLLQTKGDANATQDPNPVVPQDVRGKMWFKIASVGYFLDSVPLQVVLLAVAGVTAALWIAYEMSRVARTRAAKSGRP